MEQENLNKQNEEIDSIVVTAVADTKEPASETEETEGREPEKLTLKKAVLSILFYAGAFVFFWLLFRIFPPYLVKGHSMNKTLRDKAFGFGTTIFKPDYGDIVVLHGRRGQTNDSDYIKRVIGKPGDVLSITDGVVTRNGVKLDEPYAYYDPDHSFISGNTITYVLHDDEYFMMGDNRYNSFDSRGFGTISRSEMKCKMLFFLWGKKR